MSSFTPTPIGPTTSVLPVFDDPVAFFDRLGLTVELVPVIDSFPKAA